MKERPILFSGPMVQAVLDDCKTQTRRVMKNPEHYGCTTGDCPHERQTQCDEFMASQCPHGVPGDRLWGREAFWNYSHPNKWKGSITYRVDRPGLIESGGKKVVWKPSIHMPRWASRINLLIVGIWAEQLQEISEEDAEAEGCENDVEIIECPEGRDYRGLYAKERYEELWDSLNLKRGHGWHTNPWVWVIEFKRLEQ